MSVSPPSILSLTYQVVQATATAVTVIFRYQLAGGAQPYTISFDFGDGTSLPPTIAPVILVPGATASTTKDYAASPTGGSFNAKLTVGDTLLQQTSRNILVVIPAPTAPLPTGPAAPAPVGPPPLSVTGLAYKIVQRGPAGATVAFTASVSGGALPFSNLSWNFGDGTAPVFAPSGVTHVYPAAGGNFNVTATASDITLAQASATVLVIIPPPAMVAPAPAVSANAAVALGILAVFAVAVGAYFLLSKRKEY